MCLERGQKLQNLGHGLNLEEMEKMDNGHNFGTHKDGEDGRTGERED